MKGAIGIALLFALVAVSAAHPRQPKAATTQESSTPNANQPTSVVDLITTAQSNIQALGKQIQEQLNIPDQEKVVDTIKTQTNNLINNVETYIAQASEEIKAKSPEIKSVWEDFKGKVQQAVQQINANIPNASEQVSQLQAKFSEGVNVIVQESDKVTKTVRQNSGKAQEDIGKFTKQVVEIAVQATQNLNDQLHKAASPASAPSA